MSAPFQPGDVAVCVDDRPCGCVNCVAGYVDAAVNVRRGAHYRVESTYIDQLEGFPCLVLAGVPAREYHLRGFNAARFRKIDDEVTDEFRSMLRNLPVKHGEDA